MRFILAAIIRLRGIVNDVPSALLSTALQSFFIQHNNYCAFINRKHLISTNTLGKIVENISERAFFSHFRFLKADLLNLVSIICDSPDAYVTHLNRYFNPLLATFVLLSRLKTLYNGSGRQAMFCKHRSEIFWEIMDFFLDDKQYLSTDLLHAPFIADRSEQN